MASTPNGIATAIKDKRKEILALSFKYNGKGSTNEVIDILSDYAWIADETSPDGTNYTIKDNSLAKVDDEKTGRTTSSVFTKRNDVPYCFVIERESAVNAGFANILNLIQSFNEITKRGFDTVKRTSELFGVGGTDTDTPTLTKNPAENTPGQPAQTGQPDTKKTDPAKTDNSGSSEESKKSSGESSIIDTVGTMVNNLKDKLNGFIDQISKLDTLMDNNNLNSQIFLPYRYLYITKPTNKKFVFPMTNKDASFGTLTTKWGDAKEGPPPPMAVTYDSLVGSARGILDMVSGYLNLADNVIANLNGNASTLDTFSEVAKTFNYDTSGDNVTVSFTLYNTTRMNAWKDNYKFLYLFALRNLPFRIDSTTFIPPLLYDVVIPGVKRLPVCYVSSLDITPQRNDTNVGM